LGHGQEGSQTDGRTDRRTDGQAGWGQRVVPVGANWPIFHTRPRPTFNAEQRALKAELAAHTSPECLCVSLEWAALRCGTAPSP